MKRLIALSLNGHRYKVACEKGEEARLRELGALLDKKLRAVAGEFPHAGHAAHLVLASLSLLDMQGRDGHDAAAPTRADAPLSEGEITELARRIKNLADHIGE